MRFIPRSLHAVFDYTMGLFFLLSPWLLGLSPGPPTVIPIVIGVLTLLYNIFTHYEGGLIHVISFPVHLIMDICAGLVFLFAPFLLHFSEKNVGAFVVLGFCELGIALFTNPHIRGPVPHMRG